MIQINGDTLFDFFCDEKKKGKRDISLAQENVRSVSKKSGSKNRLSAFEKHSWSF